MSSPVNDDGDRRAMHVPPWAKDERRYDDKRRLQDEIAAEVQRLKPARAALPPDGEFHFQARHEDDGAGHRKSGSGAEPLNLRDARRMARHSPSSGPVPAHAPPKAEPAGSTWGIVPRLVGAAALAVVVAVFVTKAGWFSSIDGSAARDTNEAIAVGSLGAAAGQANTKQSVAALPVNFPLEQPSGLSQRADSQPRGERAITLARSTPEQLQPKAQQNDLQRSDPPRNDSQRNDSQRNDSRSNDARPNEAQKLPPSAVPEPRVLDFLKPEEIESLLKRGQDLIATGDISGGRLLLKRAAEAGDARASLALAGTFDAAVLATLGVLGVSPDAANARAWYTKAAEQGSPEAARRLRQLASQ
jgi:hypothetical protein